MDAADILKYLAHNQAVLTGKHFVYTSGEGGGNHGTAYINMRRVAHKTTFLDKLGKELARVLTDLEPDLIIGPETLGRTLADKTGTHLDIDAIWCDIVKLPDGTKTAQFKPKLDLGRLVKGKRVVIVDDLLTSGGSVSLVAQLVAQYGGIVVGAAVVVRRTPDVGAEQCGVSVLRVLAEVQGFEVLTREQCVVSGPCSRNEPIIRRPGHGWHLEEIEPDFPTGFTDL